ncbi:TPA: tyrosine-type recombinase/integrase [Salmonella enterica]|nr:tyrosine-type recombinase/integrase [Salmonella enterica]
MSLGMSNFIMNSSERYCLIIEQSTKLPTYYPNLFITTQVRNKNHSISTMMSTASALIVFMNYLSFRQIDIQERIYKKQFLKLSEYDELKDFIQKRTTALLKENVSKLKSRKNIYVASQTQYLRLTIIGKYIEWLSYNLIEEPDEYFVSRLNFCLSNLEERRPSKRKRNGNLKDKSLDADEIDSLFEVIRIGSPLNPFRSIVQRRNRLIIIILYYLGIRGGELLNIKISDINFSANQLSVVRRADEKTDSRVRQPLVKTNERIIPISNEVLIKELYEYISKDRRNSAKKKKHDYLFVNHRQGINEGEPLSAAAYNKIIDTIKKSSPNLRSLTGHMLRHTWNNEFSKRMDSMDNPLSPERQEKIRSYIMGWKENSGTAKIYNKRFVKEKAFEVALELQESLKGVIDGKISEKE